MKTGSMLERLRGAKLIRLVIRRVRHLLRPPYVSWLERHQRDMQRRRPRIAGIFDAMTYMCLCPDIDLHKIPRAGWREFVDRVRPELIFLESAWRGNDGEWRYTMSGFDRFGNDLVALVNHCRERRIPVVFWAKDDPPRFDIFLSVAALADVVFTTDAECVSRYRAALGHERVHPLPFGAQPHIHHPIRSGAPPQRKVLYPGSWHAHVHAERGQDLDVLLTPLLESDRLEIFDRFSGVGQERGEFPPRYQRAVRPALPYAEMCRRYRDYMAVVNVNTAKASSTMCSRRVFEALASGVPLISSPGRAMHNFFGGLLFECTSPDDVQTAIGQLENDPELAHRMAVRSVRAVYAQHLVEHRLERVTEVALGRSITVERPLVSIIIVSNRPAFLEFAVDNVVRQSYPNLELVFVANSLDFDRDQVARQLARLERAKAIYTKPSVTVGECTNLGVSRSKGEFFAKFDDDDFYAEHFLSDAVTAFRYTNAGIVGKKSFLTHVESMGQTYLRFPGYDYRYTNRVLGPTMVVDRRVWETVKFRPLRESGTDTRFLVDASRHCKLFSTDHYNFVHFRRGERHGHIWRIPDDEYLKACRPFHEGFDRSAVSI